MRIGIDLGGTKIEGIALSDAGEILVRQRIATPKGYAETVAATARYGDRSAIAPAAARMRATTGAR